MKYRQFTTLSKVVGIAAVLGLGGWGVHALTGSSDKKPTVTAVDIPETVSPPAPVQPPAPLPPVKTFTVPPVVAPVAATPPSTAQVRAKLDAWLKANPDRKGSMRLGNILPNESFKATAIRFKLEDASKFSNDPSQWSQIRVDFDADGVDEEKWLLVNGHTHKREVLDASGKTTRTDYFND